MATNYSPMAIFKVTHAQYSQEHIIYTMRSKKKGADDGRRYPCSDLCATNSIQKILKDFQRQQKEVRGISKKQQKEMCKKLVEDVSHCHHLVSYMKDHQKPRSQSVSNSRQQNLQPHANSNINHRQRRGRGGGQRKQDMKKQFDDIMVNMQEFREELNKNQMAGHWKSKGPQGKKPKTSKTFPTQISHEDQHQDYYSIHESGNVIKKGSTIKVQADVHADNLQQEDIKKPLTFYRKSLKQSLIKNGKSTSKHHQPQCFDKSVQYSPIEEEKIKISTAFPKIGGSHRNESEIKMSFKQPKYQVDKHQNFWQSWRKNQSLQGYIPQYVQIFEPERPNSKNNSPNVAHNEETKVQSQPSDHSQQQSFETFEENILNHQKKMKVKMQYFTEKYKNASQVVNALKQANENNNGNQKKIRLEKEDEIRKQKLQQMSGAIKIMQAPIRDSKKQYQINGLEALLQSRKRLDEKLKKKLMKINPTFNQNIKQPQSKISKQNRETIKDKRQSEEFPPELEQTPIKPLSANFNKAKDMPLQLDQEYVHRQVFTSNDQIDLGNRKYFKEKQTPIKRETMFKQLHEDINLLEEQYSLNTHSKRKFQQFSQSARKGRENKINNDQALQLLFSQEVVCDMLMELQQSRKKAEENTLQMQDYTMIITQLDVENENLRKCLLIQAITIQELRQKQQK